MKEPTMGKITSMHFAGWKLGLKTGMYYLRTMAASAPIQFTVDQEALKVADTNVARTNGVAKKRIVQGAYATAAVPRPMYQSKTPNGTNGTPEPTRSATPPPTATAASPAKKATPRKEAIVNPAFKADVEEGDSPKLLAMDATSSANGHTNGVKKEEVEPKQEEDDDEAREGDIYADAVLQCSIENKDACVMCSG
jgi:ribonucleoside-diphosphate reductase subunit M1